MPADKPALGLGFRVRESVGFKGLWGFRGLSKFQVLGMFGLEFKDLFFPL